MPMPTVVRSCKNGSTTVLSLTGQGCAQRKFSMWLQAAIPEAQVCTEASGSHNVTCGIVVGKTFGTNFLRGLLPWADRNGSSKLVSAWTMGPKKTAKEMYRLQCRSLEHFPTDRFPVRQCLGSQAVLWTLLTFPPLSRTPSLPPSLRSSFSFRSLLSALQRYNATALPSRVPHRNSPVLHSEVASFSSSSHNY